ncbi:MAG TPA: type II secretion system protein [Candidatus Saccharimonadales bacterium]|nr:type II secretion system protein [Candidatus Saccharimonadales bacterium]
MRSGGFTLIEVLLSTVIITLLVGLSLPVYETFVRRNDLDITAQSTVSALRRAQLNARAVKGDSIWGVARQASSIILFKGATYATRDVTYDEQISIPVSITTSGLSEISFTKLSGAPSATGSIVLSGSTNDVLTVTVNEEGMVGY